MPKRILCMLLCILLLTPFASASDRISLYIADGVWHSDALLPFIEVDGKALLPVSAFGEFNIRITPSERVGSLLLTKGDSYLSYSLGLGRVTDESGITEEASIYRYAGEIYLEPALVCEKFSLEFTTVYASDGYLSARLTGGGETLTFEELLRAYTETAAQPLPFLFNPTGKTVAGSFMHPMLLTPAEANVKSIVTLLGNHRATFVLSPSNISSYADVLPDIYAAGHTVAYYIERDDFADTDAFAEKMEQANAWLFAFIGRSTNIYVSTEPLVETPQIEGYFRKCCNMHLVSGDLASDRVVSVTLTESPGYGVYSFSLASDRASRVYYTEFFKRFDSYTHLRSMPVTESGPIQ